MKGADRKRWELTVAEGQGSARESVAERSPRQTLDHRKTKRQRGRVRATSVLANAKSEDHQDASSRAAWREGKAHVLTQGDLFGESQGGVSRGHSSVEATRKRGGAKGRRNDCKATRESVYRAQPAPNVSRPKRRTRDPRHELFPPRWCSHLKRRGEWHSGQHAAPREQASDAGGTTSRYKLRIVSNRRMRKTACPVVWEPWRAQIPSGRPDRSKRSA